MFSTPLSSNR